MAKPINDAMAAAFGMSSDDGQGELYEVRSALEEKNNEEVRRAKVSSLVSTWYRQYEHYARRWKQPPSFALEIHGYNDNPDERRVQNDDPLASDDVPASPMDGYGTYIFMPEQMKSTAVPTISNVYTTPIDIPDEWDILKSLMNNYSDEYQQERPPVATRALAPEEYDYYPIAMWSKDLAADPLNELLVLFDRLQPGQFAGISLCMRMAPVNWRDEGNKRIREINDPNYIAHPTMFQRIGGLLSDKPVKMGGRVKSLLPEDGKRERVDENMKEEQKAIREKQAKDAFECSLHVFASTDDLADDICAIIQQRTDGRWNRLRTVGRRVKLSEIANRRLGSWRERFILSSDEIATLWHVPDDNNAGIIRLHKPMPQVSTPPDSIIIVPDGGAGDIGARLGGYVRRRYDAELRNSGE